MWATYEWKKKRIVRTGFGILCWFFLFFVPYFANILMEQFYSSNIGSNTTTTFISYCVDMRHFKKSFYL
jgi:hypothetical protein